VLAAHQVPLEVEELLTAQVAGSGLPRSSPPLTTDALFRQAGALSPAGGRSAGAVAGPGAVAVFWQAGALSPAGGRSLFLAGADTGPGTVAVAVLLHGRVLVKLGAGLAECWSRAGEVFTAARLE